MFRPGRNGGPPNGWTSAFGGPAWTLDEQTGEYYLHFFTREQPDLDWHHEAVQDSFDEILRFWLDRGVDGFRIDVAHALFKAQDLPEMVEPTPRPPFGDWLSALMQPELHPLYRRWRRIADEYPGDRMYVSEITIENQDTIASYVAADQLHLSFDFTLLHEQWDAERMRATIDRVLTTLGDAGAPATWVFENHDVTRLPTRYGGGELGRRRARAAALLLFGLPGAAFAYQGQELGLEEVDVPDESAPGSDLPPHRRRAEGPRRLPRAAALDDRAADVRVHRRGAVAADARGLGAAQRRGAGARSRLDALALPLRAPPPAAPRPVRLAREPAGDDDLRPRRPDVPRQRRRERAGAAGRRAPAGERARHHHDPPPEHRSLGAERNDMKTSLGIWAFGNMATRFNAAGYKPELTGKSTAEKVRTAVEGLGDLIDDYEFHYPQELAPANLDEVRDALDGHGIYCVASGLHLDPRFGKGAFCSPDDATREEALRLTREAIDLAGETGAHMIIWPGIEGYNYPFQTPYKESWARFVDGVGQAAQHAKERGVTVFLEHKNSEPAMKILMRNIGMTLHVIHSLRREGIDNVSVNMDWQHLLMNGESLAEYAGLLAAEGLLGHLHANDGWGTFDDDNMVGTIRFMETLELAVELRRAGYGDNGERLGFDLYPYTEDAVGAVKRSVLQWRFIDGIASTDRRRRAAGGAAEQGRGAGVRARLRRDGRVRLQHVSVAIDADGADAGREFYGGLLGLAEKPVPPKLDPEQLVWFSLGGDLELHLMQTGDAPPPGAHFCIAVDTGLDELRARHRSRRDQDDDADGDRRPPALHVPRPVREPASS